MNIEYLGWFFSFILLVYLVIVILQKLALRKKVDFLESYHKKYVSKQIIDLRKICHNINTPLNTIMTVLEIFNLKLYGDIGTKYSNYVNGASDAIDDLKKNVKDIQLYCNYYVDNYKLSIKEIQIDDKKFDNPYVLNF